MKTWFPILFLSFVNLSADDATPLELSIHEVALPKVGVTAKNTHALRNIRLWSRGNSWGDTAIRFEVLNSAGKPFWKLEPRMRTYTLNFPSFVELRPGEEMTLNFDLADADEWASSDGMLFQQGIMIRAVLRQTLEIESHVNGVFIGEAKSAWAAAAKTDGSASCIEWSPVPKVDSGPSFAASTFIEGLGKLTIRQDTSAVSLLDSFGAQTPWSQIGFLSSLAQRDNGPPDSASFLFPGSVAVTLFWDVRSSLGDKEKLRLAKALNVPKFGDAGKDQPGWASASEVLPVLPARGITCIIVQGPPPLRNQNWRLQRDGRYRKQN